MLRAALAALFLLGVSALHAQPLTSIGPITSGHCVQYNSPNVVKDSGAPCSSTANSGTNLAVDYNYTRSPGGSLIVGPNTVTLTSCPLGVAGTDTGHYIRISGGVGAAETVLITGGTCTSGATTGTVVFTAVNTHSGAWTAASSSAGIDEALRIGVTPTVVVPSGVSLIYAPTTSMPTGSSLYCNGGMNGFNTSEPCELQHQVTNTPMFLCTNDNVTWRRLSLTNSTVAVAGSVGIKTQTGCNSFIMEDVTVWKFYYGLEFTDPSWSSLRDVKVFFNVSHGIVTHNAQGPWTNLDVESNGGDALNLGVNGAGGNAIPFLKGFHTFNNGGRSIYSNAAGVDVSGFYLNFDWEGVVIDPPVGGGPGSGKCADMHDGSIEVIGSTITHGTNTTAKAVTVTATSGQPLCMSGALVNTNQGIGLHLQAGNSQITASTIQGSGNGGVAGNLFDVLSDGGFNRVGAGSLLGCSKFSGGADNITSSSFACGRAALPALDIGAGAIANTIENNQFTNAVGIAWRISASALVKGPFTNTVLSGSTSVGNASITGTMWGRDVKVVGAGFGSVTHTAASAVGDVTYTWPIANLNMSATGGTMQFMRQNSAGGALDFFRPTCASLSDSGAACNQTLASGVATWLGAPSSANLLSAMTDKTGTGLNVFGTSPSLVTPVLGAASATSVAFTSTSGVIGTTTNDAAAAGSVGQLLENDAALDSVSLSTGVSANVGQLSITAGDWEVTCTVYFKPAGTTAINVLSASISTTSITFDFTLGRFAQTGNNGAVTGANYTSIVTPPLRVSLSGTTTHYCVANAGFGTSTMTAGGRLHARRVR